MIRNNRDKMSGYVTLTISILLLVIVTLIAFFTAQPILMESKIANNVNRSNIALEAAESGLAVAITYLSNDPDVDSDNVIDSVFDTNADGVGDADEITIGDGSVTVAVQDLSGTGEMTPMLVTATGFSDDRSATRVISQVVGNVPPLPNTPDNPLTTRGTVVIDGSATIHNPEGHSTIWSGGDVDLGSNNSTATNVADPSDAGYPACMDTPMTCGTTRSSNKTGVGLDVIEYDGSLAALDADGMFENFFGMSPEAFKASMVSIETDGANFAADADLAEREVIWVDGDVDTGKVTVGCSAAVTGGNVCSDANTKPSIVVVDGDMTLSGTPHFYGIVFVMGNMDISSNSTIHGALISAGNTGNSTGGSLDIWYNSDILAGLALAGPMGGLPGTWRDF